MQQLKGQSQKFQELSGEEILDPFASKNSIRKIGQNGIDAGTKNNAEDIAGGTRTTSRRGDNGNCDCDVSGDRKWQKACTALRLQGLTQIWDKKFHKKTL